MRAIGSRVSDWWVRHFQTRFVNTLHGVYLSNVANNSGDMIRDIGTDASGAAAAAELISAEAILDAAQTMGDNSDKLDTIIMHSIVYNRLAKLNLIDFIPDARGETKFASYLGYRVIRDDGARIIAGTNRVKYVTYLVGRGAFAFGEAPMLGTPNVELDRKPEQGNGMGVDLLFTRRQFIMHPYGFRWTDASTAGETPTRAELALATNWVRCYPERKQVPLAFLLTNG
jgi:hypothetical protein